METDAQLKSKVFAFKYKALDNWQFFPWGWFGFSIPSYGPTHSYLATYMAQYGNTDEKLFLPQKPSMSELRRFTEGEGNQNYIAKTILNHCDGLYAMRAEHRSSTPAEVLSYIKQNSDFIKDFEAKLHAKARLGYFD